MLKQKFFVVFAVLMILLVAGNAVFGDDSVTVYVNGKKLDERGFIAGGRSMVPIKAVLGELGIRVYQSDKADFLCVRNNREFLAFKGSKRAVAGGKTLELSIAPVVQEWVLYAPLQFLKAVYPCYTVWDESSRSLLVYSSEPEGFNLGNARQAIRVVEQVESKLKKDGSELKILQEAVRLDPGNAVAYTYLETAYEEALAFEKAEDCREKILLMNPENVSNYESAFLFSQRYMSSKSIDRMVQLAKAHIEDPYDLSDVLEDAGRRCYDSGLIEQGCRYYKESVDVPDPDPFSIGSVGFGLYCMNRYEEALTYFEKASRHYTNPYFDIMQAKMQMRLGRKDEGERRLISMGQWNGSACNVYGDECLESGDAEKALVYYNRALELGDKDAFLGKGRALIILKRYKEGQEALGSFLRENPDDYSAYYYKAKGYVLSGDPWPAKAAIEKAYSIARENPNVVALYSSIVNDGLLK